MRERVFSRPEIQTRFEKFVGAELFTDKDEKAKFNKKLRADRFREDSMPLYIVLSSDGSREFGRAKYMPDVERFGKFLDDAYALWEAEQ